MKVLILILISIIMSENELFKIPEEALKKIKTQEEFEEFIQRLYKQGVEALLKAEINEHLGYPKHDPSGKNSGNSRNGFSKKTLKTNLGEVPLDVPRDRNSTFVNRKKKYSDFGKMKCSKFGNKSTVFLGTTLQ